MKNYYKCECGQEFDNPQKFNGHKSHCEVHLKAVDKGESYREQTSLRVNKTKKTGSEKKARYQKQKKYIEDKKICDGISEQHHCEYCGKLMTERYGSGRFCCRACSNSRIQTPEINEKRRQASSEAMKKRGREHPETGSGKKENNYQYCKNCGKKIAYTSKTNFCLTCLKTTPHGQSIYKKYAGGYRKGSGKSKHGYYKTIYCDSTYELVGTIYCLDHNISFKRCKLKYRYGYKGKQHTYHPDYELADGSLVELKGYYREVVDYKLAAVTDRKINIYYKKDIQYMFDYVRNNYSYKKLEDLYDKN